MTREEIKYYIKWDIEKAIENKNEVIYWLEKLPRAIDVDCDLDVQEYIQNIAYCIRNDFSSGLKLEINDLTDYYYNNQEYYKFD